MDKSDGECKVAVGINGFGRIGRMVLRAAVQKHSDTVQICAINDPFLTPEYICYLLTYDSTYGNPRFKVECGEDFVVVNGQKIAVFAAKNAADVPWASVGVVTVAETSGHYNTTELCLTHLEGGAKKVVMSAPAKDSTTPTFVLGVNEQDFDPTTMNIISNASCTTNCVAPLVKILHESFGIEEGMLTTIHAVTATQTCVDGVSKKDYRLGRSALQNIIPASTGATKAVARAYPAVEGKLTGLAFRVPVADVSVVDLTVKLQQPVQSINDIAADINKASLPSIIGCTTDAVVSSDFLGDGRSCIFDVTASILLNPTFVKLVAYYDNEWAYAMRMVQTLP